MATSTLIQYLETTAVTGLGVSVGVGAASMNRRQTETFIAKENLVVGDFVAFDLAATADGDVQSASSKQTETALLFAHHSA
jgi:hypothetical protein